MEASLEEIKQNFVGKWRVDRDENFEEFITELGDGNPLMRTLSKHVKPKSKIFVEGDHVTITFKAGPIKTVGKFRLGEDFDFTFMGVKRKVTPSYIEGQILWDMQPYDSKHNAMHQTREMINGELVLTVSVGQVQCKRYFKRLQ